MILRPACATDAVALADLGRTSFRAAFGHLYRRRDLEAFLADTYSVERVATEIADARIIHIVAQDGPGSALTGFCKLTTVSPYATHSDAVRPVALSQLYCHPARTGQGIGATLMERVLSEARARDADAIQLSVWAHNHRAQRFYARYGFGKIADIEFCVGEQVDEEFLFELRLSDRRQRADSGSSASPGCR